MKAEMNVLFIFWSETQVSFVYSKNKTKKKPFPFKYKLYPCGFGCIMCLYYSGLGTCSSPWLHEQSMSDTTVNIAAQIYKPPPYYLY